MVKKKKKKPPSQMHYHGSFAPTSSIISLPSSGYIDDTRHNSQIEKINLGVNDRLVILS